MSAIGSTAAVRSQRRVDRHRVPAARHKQGADLDTYVLRVTTIVPHPAAAIQDGIRWLGPRSPHGVDCHTHRPDGRRKRAPQVALHGQLHELLLRRRGVPDPDVEGTTAPLHRARTREHAIWSANGATPVLE